MKKPSICIAARAESGVREKWKGSKKNDTNSRRAQSGTARTRLEKWRNLLPKAG